MGDTKIQWTDKSWNPSTGCTKVSTGCKNCYAERLFPRVYSKDVIEVQGVSPDLPGDERRRPLYRPRKFTDVKLHPDRLDQPLHWKKPRMVFVDSMSDLFHGDIPFEFIDKIFAVMALSKQHTFQILTKRLEIMLEYMKQFPVAHMVDTDERTLGGYFWEYGQEFIWPLPNVWQGTSIEDQPTADERIPILLQIPAAIRFLSCEPLLDEIDIEDFLTELGVETCNRGEDHKLKKCSCQQTSVDWVIVGGESGPGYRPMNLDWARSIRDQCKEAGVPFFFKQTAGKKAIPEDLKIMEYPDQKKSEQAS